jgi:hypothetical protein
LGAQGCLSGLSGRLLRPRFGDLGRLLYSRIVWRCHRGDVSEAQVVDGLNLERIYGEADLGHLLLRAIQIRPVRTDICDWSDRNRWDALTIDSVSLPTLNAMTAFTLRAMPCFVTQFSSTSGFRHGQRNEPHLAKQREDEGAPPGHDPERRLGALLLPPDMSIPSSGAGTW